MSIDTAMKKDSKYMTDKDFDLLFKNFHEKPQMILKIRNYVKKDQVENQKMCKRVGFVDGGKPYLMTEE
jgi:hypothetical protein